MAYKKRRKKSRKKYKIMKGGSLAGRFFRFLAGENNSDRLRLNELKELDEYKRQKKIRKKIENEEKMKENIENNFNKDKEQSKTYLENYKIMDKLEEEQNENNILQQGGGNNQSLQEIHNNDRKNFFNWFNDSNINYNELVKKRDPQYEETANDLPGGFSWKRNQNDMVGDFSYHLKNYSSQTGGTKKRKKKKRKRKTKKMLCFRGNIKSLKKFGKKNTKKSKKKVRFTKGSRKRYNKWRKRK